MHGQIFHLEDTRDLDEAQQLVETVVGKSLGEPEHITHGYINQVLLYEHERLVARFPRSAYAAGQLKHDGSNLDLLTTVSLPVAVPRLIHLSLDPTWSLSTFIPGHVYASTEIQRWDTPHKLALGVALAKFLGALHSQLVVKDFHNNQPPLLEQLATDIANCPESPLKSLAAVELEKLEKLAPAAPTYVIYGDTHGSNLIFDENKKLRGVIDFADMHVGSAEEEFRLLYMLDPIVCESAVQHYLKAGRKLDMAHIRQWAIVYELAVLCRHHNEPNYPSIARAKAHLKTWIGFAS